jgi:hypothetical protein
MRGKNARYVYEQLIREHVVSALDGRTGEARFPVKEPSR